MTVVQRMVPTAGIVYQTDGGRSVRLYLPFEMDGQRIEAINFVPLEFGHSLDWRAGKYKSVMELLCALTGVREDVIRKLRYPDIDRVMSVFFDIMPEEMRSSVSQADIVEQEQEAILAQNVQEALANIGTGAAPEPPPPPIFDPNPPPGFPTVDKPSIPQPRTRENLLGLDIE